MADSCTNSLLSCSVSVHEKFQKVTKNTHMERKRIRYAWQNSETISPFELRFGSKVLKKASREDSGNDNTIIYLQILDLRNTLQCINNTQKVWLCANAPCSFEEAQLLVGYRDETVLICWWRTVKSTHELHTTVVERCVCSLWAYNSSKIITTTHCQCLPGS